MTTIRLKAPRDSREKCSTLAGEMHANGTMDDATYRKITMRDVRQERAGRARAALGREIRALRERARMSKPSWRGI